jgi:hypothetical protein
MRVPPRAESSLDLRPIIRFHKPAHLIIYQYEDTYIADASSSLDLGAIFRFHKPAHMSIQVSTKLSPVDHLVDGILVLVQKGSNAKKESFCSTEP